MSLVQLPDSNADRFIHPGASALGKLRNWVIAALFVASPISATSLPAIGAVSELHEHCAHEHCAEVTIPTAPLANIEEMKKKEGKIAAMERANMGEIQHTAEHQIDSCKVVIHADYKEYQSTETIILNSVRNLIQQGYELPDLDFYISKQPGVKNVAFMSDAEGNTRYQIFLGPKLNLLNPMMKDTAGLLAGGIGVQGRRGIADQEADKAGGAPSLSKSITGLFVSKEKEKKASKAQAVITHELGHVLHAHQHHDAFWSLKVRIAKQDNVNAGLLGRATEVSHYATENCLETVAEVFTGRVYGARYAEDINTGYAEIGGPHRKQM